ncbi:MAG: dicarboxylate/amino acid:cation symporter [Myxococcales bacterium]|nr:dicarboxylate/amino acid:cation symporter [Myxococcales bacterium]
MSAPGTGTAEVDERRGSRLHVWIALAAVAAVAIGLPLERAARAGWIDVATVRWVAHAGHELGGLFLSLLRMLVVPLVATSLISAVCNLGDLRRLGRLGARTVAWYALTTSLAILTGLLLVQLVRPGDGIEPGTLGVAELPASVREQPTGVGAVLWRQLRALVPSNPFAALASGDMLPVIFFSLLFGLFVVRTGGVAGARMRDWFGAAFEVVMRMTGFVVSLAPFGVFGFVLHAAAGAGLEAFVALGRYVLVVAAGLLVHAAGTLPALLWLVAKRSPRAHARAMAPALLTAFGTASSNAALPLTMRCARERAGMPAHVGAFVLPLGATVNMDGTALYEAVAVLFIGQVYGLDLGLGAQLAVALTALLASVGAAGIPHAGLVMMVVVLDVVGLPADAVGLILAVDRVLDMARTTVNVWSDAVVAALVSRAEDASPAMASGLESGAALDSDADSRSGTE